MQKEILTKDVIKNELKTLYKFKLKKLFITLILIFTILAVVLFVILQTNENKTKTYIIMILILSVIIVNLRLFVETIYAVIVLFKNNVTEVEIINERVVEKKTSIETNFRSKPYRLVLSNRTLYSIPWGMNYKWSQIYAMKDENVYNTFEINDEVYIVNVGKLKNVLAYNKKYFKIV
ncbi:MAG: hypothetical protein Q4B40_03750 [Clostridia bacterium]|nr:hypothetical protein [Clostridia bacterium]